MKKRKLKNRTNFNQFLREAKGERKPKGWGRGLLMLTTLVGINFILMTLFGLFTIDSFATETLHYVGLLFSFLCPILLISITPKMKRMERFLKFGFGPLIYLVIAIFSIGIAYSLEKFLLLSLLIYLISLWILPSIKRGAKKQSSDLV